MIVVFVCLLIVGFHLWRKLQNPGKRQYQSLQLAYQAFLLLAHLLVHAPHLVYLYFVESYYFAVIMNLNVVLFRFVHVPLFLFSSYLFPLLFWFTLVDLLVSAKVNKVVVGTVWCFFRLLGPLYYLLYSPSWWVSLGLIVVLAFQTYLLDYFAPEIRKYTLNNGGKKPKSKAGRPVEPAKSE